MCEVENLAQVRDTRVIVTRLCRLFYNLQWVTGTGGGISIRDRTDEDVVYITPSGVQKEYIDEKDLFVYSLKSDLVLTPPYNECLKLSECTPLFLACYKQRGMARRLPFSVSFLTFSCSSFTDAGAVMHSHSMQAAFLTVLLKTQKEFRLANFAFHLNSRELVLKSFQNSN